MSSVGLPVVVRCLGALVMVPHFVMPKKMVQLFIEKFPIDKEGTAAKQLELFVGGKMEKVDLEVAKAKWLKDQASGGAPRGAAAKKKPAAKKNIRKPTHFRNRPTRTFL